MCERVARHADAEVRLVRLLVMDLHARSVGLNLRGRGLAGLGGRQVTEQLLDLRDRVAADVAAEADDHSLRLFPPVSVADEGVFIRVPDRFLAADDVPAERLVAVEQLLVDAAYEVRGRVVVHVYLLEANALFPL